MSVSVAYEANYTGWTGAAKLYCKLVDDHCFGFGRAERLIKSAHVQCNAEGVRQGHIDKAIATASFTGYLFKGARKVSELGVILDLTPVLEYTTPVGFATLGLSLAKSTAAIRRQNQFISMLSKVERTANGLFKALSAIGGMSMDQLENRVHYAFLKKRDLTPQYFRDLAFDIQLHKDPEKIQEANDLIDMLQAQATKKLYVHVIEILAALVACAGLITAMYGMLYLAPFIVAAGLALQMTRYFTANGWASQEKGFSFTSCVPMCIRRKFTPSTSFAEKRDLQEQRTYLQTADTSTLKRRHVTKQK